MRPEEWRAKVLADEVFNLTIMVRSLEFQLGFLEGRQAGRWESVEEAKVAGAVSQDAAMAGADRKV